MRNAATLLIPLVSILFALTAVAVVFTGIAAATEAAECAAEGGTYTVENLTGWCR